MTKNQSDHLVGYMGIDIFLRDFPTKPCLSDQLNTADDRVGFASCQEIAAASDRLRALGRIPKRDGGHMKDTTLLLDRAAVGQNAEGRLLQFDEVEEIKGGAELDQGMGFE